MVKEITSETEFKLILQENEVVVADFFATWCGPCRMIAPSLETLEKDLGDKVKIIKIDIDKQAALTRRHDVTAMPTFHFFVKGELVNTIVGAHLAKVTAVAQELGNKAAARKAASAPAPAAPAATTS